MGDSIFIAQEFEFDLDWFLEEITQAKQKRDIFECLNLAEAMSNAHLIGSKKGNELYNNWRRRKVRELNQLSEQKEETVFDRLKQNRVKTIFDRLKEARNN